MVRNPRHPALAGKITDRQMDLIVRQIASLPISPEVGRAMLNLTLRSKTDSPSDEYQRQMLALARLDPYLRAFLLSTDRQDKPSKKSRGGDGGFARLESLILGANLKQLLEPAAPSRLDLGAFWRHCIATGVAARKIAEHLALPVSAEDVFDCGLLHDLGKLAMDSSLPKSYARVLAADKSHLADIARNEQELLGVDHAAFGRRLSGHWRLPELVESAIWLHHNDPVALPESLADRSVVAAVGLADAVARKAGVGFSGNFVFAQPLDSWAKSVGCDEAFIAQLVAELPQLVEAEIAIVAAATAQGPAKVGPALAEHVSKRDLDLTQRASALESKARAMDLLKEFLSGVAQETSVARSLSQIAKTGAAALGHESTTAEPIVAYSLESFDRVFATACRCDGPDSFTWQTIACPQEMLPGTDAVAEWFDLGDYIDEPILAGGKWIGGILFPASCVARADEAWTALVASMGLSLKLVQDQARAIKLNDELSAASRVLAETSRALSEAQTVSAIGQMAAGAAHELNNPLAVISGRAQLMASKAATPEEKKVWTTMVEQAQRISDIITDLMNFASPPKPEPEALDVRAMLESARPAKTKGAAPKVDIEVEAPCPRAYVDPSQMDAVLRELISNASAAGGAGVHIRMSAAGDGGEVVITVADDGPGMDDKTLSRAFTPFYSDHPAGRRRGLGLARVRRWVENNGGSVRLESKIGSGTRVIVRVPGE